MLDQANRDSLRVSMLAFCAAILLVLFCFVAPFRSQYGESLIILALTISALSLMLVDNLFDERPRPVHLLFCIYMIFSFLLPGYFHTVMGRFPFFAAEFSPERILNAAIVVAVFVVCVWIGYGIDFSPRYVGRQVIVPAKLFTALLVCGGAAFVAGAMAGFGSLRAPRRDDVLADALPSPDELIISEVARSTSFFAFMFSAFYVRFEKTITALLSVIAAFGFFLFLNSPLTIPRSMVASYLIGMFFVFFRVTRLRKLILTIALVSSQVTVFSYLSYISRGDRETAFRFSPFEQYVTNGDFDGFQSTINVVAMHDERGGKEGVNLLSALFFFVPRKFWPEKSMGTGPEAGMFAGYPFVNLSSPLPSEFYIDFGLAGVVVLSSLFGIFVRLCDEYYSRFKKTDDLVGQVVISTVAGWIFVILRGSLVATLGPIALSIAIAFVCHRYATVPVSRGQDLAHSPCDDEAEIGPLANWPSHRPS